MKIRNIPTSKDFYEESISFEETHIEVFEEEERKPFPAKKALVSTIMAISVGIIITGVSFLNSKPEVHNAVVIEDSKWSEFDSSKIDSYFNILSSGTEYKMLEAMCADDSKVYSTVLNSEANMQYLYDEYYGIAQGVQKFGSYISISSVNGVSDNKVSLSINYVSEADLVEFFNANSNDLCRYFTSHELSKDNFVRELFNLLDTYKVETSKTTIELPVKKVDGLYTIADDLEISILLTNTYEKAINEMVRQVSFHK